MPYQYKNVLNLPGSDSIIRTVVGGIQFTQFGSGSIDLNKITPMPPWIPAGTESAREH